MGRGSRGRARRSVGLVPAAPRPRRGSEEGEAAQEGAAVHRCTSPRARRAVVLATLILSFTDVFIADPGEHGVVARAEAEDHWRAARVALPSASSCSTAGADRVLGMAGGILSAPGPIALIGAQRIGREPRRSTSAAQRKSPRRTPPPASVPAAPSARAGSRWAPAATPAARPSAAAPPAGPRARPSCPSSRTGRPRPGAPRARPRPRSWPSWR